MSKNKISGDTGEQEVVEKVPCPNCGKKLILLPTNNPLYDVQCERCVFRAQVKTNKSKPKDEIFGAGWDIVDKVLKSGFLMPPLITNFHWVDKNGEHQVIYLYPFIQKENLKKHLADIKSQGRKYWMFNYIGLSTLPHFVLYSK